MDQTIPNKAPIISVIVPVYQAEAFLDQCVQSMLAQTERDFELLLIDDGSPDNSPALCDAYAARDSRVRVIHKPNGGVSSARNAGLDAAAGKFVVFLDSDDWAEPDYLSRLLTLQTQTAEEGVLVMTD
jgi:glycosyltransferase EpsJ